MLVVLNRQGLWDNQIATAALIYLKTKMKDVIRVAI